MTDLSAVALTPRPTVGRLFTGHRLVRLGDVRPDGSLRLDALTRYTQDVSNDDTGDAELPDDMAWVVRRTVVDVIRPAVFGESLEFVTFCSGLGNRWAERRLSVRGDHRAHYEVATLWIYIEASSGRPRLLGERFLELYGPASQGRKVQARLTHRPFDPASELVSWPLRRVDFDLFNHVNNAAYWAAVEELLPDLTSRRSAPSRFTVEYRDGIGPEVSVRIARHRVPGVDELWWLTGPGNGVAASARVERVDPDWY